MKMLIRFSLMSCMLFCMPLVALADVYVIVNAGNPVTALSREQVERIFLLKSKHFDDGSDVSPVDQKLGSPARNAFNKLVLERSEQQLQYYWARRMFSGTDRPPAAVYSDNEVQEFVAGKLDGIGYTLKPPTSNDVRVVLHEKN